MFKSISTILVIFLFIPPVYANEKWDQKVYYHGHMDTLFNSNGISETFNISKLQSFENLYAIGLLEHLQGEVLVIDLKSYITKIDNTQKLTLQKTLANEVSFISYSIVPQWKSVKIPSYIYNKKQFEEFLEEAADEHGIDTYKPYPFMIEGTLKANKYRVLTHKPQDTIRCETGSCSYNPDGVINKSKPKYIKLSKYSTALNQKVKILGFYSPKRGVITEKNSYLNMNFIDSRHQTSGHILNMMLGKDMKLLLPKI